MKIAFSATNPCHVYDQALALFEAGHLGVFYSGYPRWRLKPPASMPVVTASWRTVITYALQRCPERLRPRDDAVFRWQDEGFDRQVARLLDPRRCDILHCIPGQALATIKRAKALGIPTVLNHATGPINQHRELISGEFDRVGLKLEETQPLLKAWSERLDAELAMADWHCVASSIVKDQLVIEGVDPARIRIIPYGVDERLFAKRAEPPDGPFRICFAGRQTLRKGITYLLQALELASAPDWELHVFGMPMEETAPDFARYKGAARVVQHGAVSQAVLARELQRMHVLVLPSAEEAFGLVVVQALQCGVPCIVSDRVGAKDLLRPGSTGDVFPFGDVPELARVLARWQAARAQVDDPFPRAAAVTKLVAFAREVIGDRNGCRA